MCIKKERSMGMIDTQSREKKNLCKKEGDLERGRGSWTGEESWCRDGGVATDERRGGVVSYGCHGFGGKILDMMDLENVNMDFMMILFLATVL